MFDDKKRFIIEGYCIDRGPAIGSMLVSGYQSVERWSDCRVWRRVEKQYILS